MSEPYTYGAHHHHKLTQPPDDAPLFCRQVFADALKVEFCFPYTRSKWGKLSPNPMICLSDSHYGYFYVTDRDTLYSLFFALYVPYSTKKKDIREMMDSHDPPFVELLRDALDRSPRQVINLWFAENDYPQPAKIVRSVTCADFHSTAPHLLEDVASYFRDLEWDCATTSPNQVAVVAQHYKDKKGISTQPALIIRRPGLGFVSVICHDEKRLIISGSVEFVQGLHYFRVRAGRWAVLKTKAWGADFSVVLNAVKDKWDSVVKHTALQFSSSTARALALRLRDEKAQISMRSAELDALEASDALKATNYHALSNSFSSFKEVQK